MSKIIDKTKYFQIQRILIAYLRHYPSLQPMQAELKAVLDTLDTKEERIEVINQLRNQPIHHLELELLDLNLDLLNL